MTIYFKKSLLKVIKYILYFITALFSTVHPCSAVDTLDISDLSVNAIINKSYDISTPSDISFWDKSWYGVFPNGANLGSQMSVVCLSENNAATGACKTTVSWAHYSGEDHVSLLFTEERTGLQHIAQIKGHVTTSCSEYSKFIGNTFGCSPYIEYRLYLPKETLKAFPSGGIWKAHLKLNVRNYGNDAFHAPWDFYFTLKVTDNQNIRIWLPQFYGSTANVVMPITPAYYALHTPGQVAAERIVETCLYDGYSSNSKRFEVTLNSNHTDPVTKDFLLQNQSAPSGKSLHYQVIASTPGQQGTMTLLKPGITQTYSGINTAPIRQVMMPGLQVPVACVPWPIKIKLLPFDLSRQQAGHYSGTLSLTFTPSLD